MTDKKKSQKAQFNEYYVQELNNAGKIVAFSAKSTQKAAEDIMISLNIAGTKGEAHKRMLLAVVDNMKRLAALYNSFSRRLLSSADKIINGMPEEDVTADMDVYKKFITDQLKCEEDEKQRILDILLQN